jgi:CrcB protein
MNYLLIGIAGAAGAIARYVVGGYVSSNTSTAYPLGTLIINVSGSLVLGFVATAGMAWLFSMPLAA